MADNILEVISGTVSSGLVAVGGAAVGDAQELQIYGSTFETTVSSGGFENVQSGGYASGTVVLVNGSQYISGGGIADATQVQEGLVRVFRNGILNSAVVSGGWLRVQGGTVNHAEVLTGANFMVQADANTAAVAKDTVLAGGNLTVLRGGEKAERRLIFCPRAAYSAPFVILSSAPIWWG